MTAFEFLTESQQIIIEKLAIIKLTEIYDYTSNHIKEILHLPCMKSLAFALLNRLGSFAKEPQQKKERIKRQRMKDDNSKDKVTDVKKVCLYSD